MTERWAILVEGEGTAEEYGTLFDTIADAAYLALGDACDLSGQRMGEHDEECPAGARIVVDGCECRETKRESGER